jgi:hypothetical protein
MPHFWTDAFKRFPLEKMEASEFGTRETGGFFNVPSI